MCPGPLSVSQSWRTGLSSARSSRSTSSSAPIGTRTSRALLPSRRPDQPAFLQRVQQGASESASDAQFELQHRLRPEPGRDHHGRTRTVRTCHHKSATTARFGHPMRHDRAMHRILATSVLAVLLVTALTACSSNEGDGNSVGESDTSNVRPLDATRPFTELSDKVASAKLSGTVTAENDPNELLGAVSRIMCGAG